MPRLRTPAAVLTAVAVVTVVSASCAPPFPKLSGQPGPAAERVSVSQFRDLGIDVQQAAFDAAGDVGAGAALLHSGTLGVVNIYRDTTPVALAPSNAQFPIFTAATEQQSATELYGEDIGTALLSGVAVTSTTASLFNATVGDLVAIRTLNNQGNGFVRIAAVVEDSRLPAEVLLPMGAANALGFFRPTSVQIYGYPSNQAINDALAARGLTARGDVRISRPGQGGSSSPDATLALGEWKAKLGMFWYISRGGGAITIDPAWQQANIVRTAFTGVPIVANCHRAIVPAIQGALNEIGAAGLAGAIDTANTNRYGGCFGPREVRSSGGTTGGNLSRHSWGGALDMNTVTNPMGGVPTMDCRVVFIFRKWGFAWGGNFLTPDGMHFEYVGEDRSQLDYPSTYCPNPVSGVQAEGIGDPDAVSFQETYED